MRHVFCVVALGAALLAAACGGNPLDLWDVAAKRAVSLDEGARRFAEADIVYLGESHDVAAHHAAQLAIITAMATIKPDLAVGIEMFPHHDQDVLDAWVGGSLDETALREAFALNWGMAFELYRDIFVFCRERRIPMIALNAPREIVRQVARDGFASLTPEQIGELPPVACVVDPAYEAFLRRMFGAHHHGHASSFAHFCEAQVVWDTAMAYYAVRFLSERPSAVIAVLCGQIHAWRPAMPSRVESLAPGIRQIIVLPRAAGAADEDTVTPQDADYLILGLE